ncbi:o-succinylbenzoate--CoA ligase [Sporolactobacillus shoreicorticis]|uniref:2-succinylbenzoate--CoA ligase n=1 Tax=Sporolactobacillus shoreicorticis TaxID=1923877 RepID=A0ABW5S7F9_9BACL|nr:o-succinylbenzoate--CoA ligase [Sporolactobacillus shoreicorticis]MCO7125515.1 o-succinylbenzoate--CoA ligase [Sporolactobacillus shoreicorticis]
MPQWLNQRARLTPNRIAFETEDARLTFKQLLVRTRQAASALRSAGVHSADRVASLQSNTLPYAVTVHALMMLGAVMVPLNTRLSADELAGQIQDSGCRLLITDQKFEQKASQVSARVSCALIHSEKWTDCEALPDDFNREIQLENPCTIIFTSGTTGHPKGVVLSYGNHWWNANASLINLGLSPDDKWLCCVPLFHVSGLSILMKSVIYGMTVYLQETFDPQTVNQLITCGGITHISVVASMLQRMIDTLGDQNTYPKTLRCVLLGGGPVPNALLKRCLNLQMPIYQTYGMSETASQAVTLPPEYMLEKAGSAGQPLFPLQVRISAAAPNTPGEIMIKGPTVFSYYLNNPEATHEAFDGEWFRSGDIGYLDKDGFLFVLDRRKDLIISGGENVYPAEVESVLNGCKGISCAGVIGIPDSRWGRVPIAFVSLKEGADFSESELINECKQHLASYKVPKRIFVLAKLPENASRKLLRRKLYEEYEKMNRVN